MTRDREPRRHPPPATDAGTTPNLHWSFADSHVSIYPGGWTRQTTAATPDDLAETGRLVQGAGRRGLAIQADQRDRGALRQAAEQVRQTFGGLDVVFANAGVQAFKPLLGMSDADWDDQIENNLTGTANTLRAFAPLLVARGGGRVVVTSSTQGRHGTKFGASYSASKWGIIGLMKSAALEWGAHHITVNAPPATARTTRDVGRRTCDDDRGTAGARPADVRRVRGRSRRPRARRRPHAAREAESGA